MLEPTRPVEPMTVAAEGGEAMAVVVLDTFERINVGRSMRLMVCKGERKGAR